MLSVLSEGTCFLTQPISFQHRIHRHLLPQPIQPQLVLPTNNVRLVPTPGSGQPFQRCPGLQNLHFRGTPIKRQVQHQTSRDLNRPEPNPFWCVPQTEKEWDVGEGSEQPDYVLMIVMIL